MNTFRGDAHGRVPPMPPWACHDNDGILFVGVGWVVTGEDGWGMGTARRIRRGIVEIVGTGNMVYNVLNTGHSRGCSPDGIRDYLSSYFHIPAGTKMAKKYRRYEPKQSFLIQHDIREWLPEDHLAFFVDDARGFKRFLLRGFEKVKGEWSLIAITHNLLKLWRNRRPRPIP